MSEGTAQGAAPASTTTPAAGAPGPARAPAAAPAGKPAPVSASSLKQAIRSAGGDPDASYEDTDESAEAPVEEEAPVGEEAPVEEEEAAAAPEYPAEIHGVPLAELIQALQEGKLPDALWDVIQDELVDGDDRETRPLRDFRDGAMMHRNYTKKSMALAEDRRQLETREASMKADQDEFHSYVRTWKDPKAFKRAAQAMGLPLMDMLVMVAEEHEARSKLPPEALKVLDAAEAREIEMEKKERILRAKEREMRAAEAKAAQQSNQVEGDAYAKFIQSHMPAAFAAAGLVETPETRQIIFSRFKDALDVFWPAAPRGQPQTPPSKEAVYRAAKAAAELLGVKPGATPAKAQAGASPARQAVAKAQASAQAGAAKPKPLAGAKAYDTGASKSPARQAVTARSFMQAQRKGLAPR